MSTAPHTPQTAPGITVATGNADETRALETEGPVLVDVVTAREELSMPPTITAAQIKGFTVWALKTVLSGRGDELLDLADTNVWRRLFH